MTREAKIVVFFYVNLVRFGKGQPVLLAPVVRALAAAISFGRVKDTGVFPHLLSTLSAVIGVYGGDDPAGVCMASLECMRIMLIERARKDAAAAAATAAAAAYTAASASVISGPGGGPGPAGMMGAAALRPPGKEELDLATVLLNVVRSSPGNLAFRSLALGVLGEILELFNLAEKADAVLGTLLLCHEQIKGAASVIVFLPGPVNPATVPPAAAFYMQCTQCFSLLLSLPTVAAWRGKHFDDLLGWAVYGAVHLRGPLRAGVLSCLGQMFSAGKVGLASDFAGAYFARLAAHFSDTAALIARARDLGGASGPAAVSLLDGSPLDGSPPGGPRPLDAAAPPLSALFPAGWSVMRSTVNALYSAPIPGVAQPPLAALAVQPSGTYTPVEAAAVGVMEDGVAGLVEVLLLLSLGAGGERKLIETIMGIFGQKAFAAVEAPLLGEIYAAASLKLTGRLLEHQEALARAHRDLDARSREAAKQQAGLSKELENLATENAATREKLKDCEGELDAIKTSLACSICLEAFVNRDPVSLVCGHIYCGSCITAFMGHRGESKCCPQCRHPIQGPDAVRRLRGLG